MSAPLPMLLWCPGRDCGERHIDEGEFATKEHHTHACQSCGMVWRPAIVPTVGVQFLPGFKDRPAAPPLPHRSLWTHCERNHHSLCSAQNEGGTRVCSCACHKEAPAK